MLNQTQNLLANAKPNAEHAICYEHVNLLANAESKPDAESNTEPNTKPDTELVTCYKHTKPNAKSKPNAKLILELV